MEGGRGEDLREVGEGPGREGGGRWSWSCLGDVGWGAGAKCTRTHNCVSAETGGRAGAQVNIMALAHVHAHAEKSQT